MEKAKLKACIVVQCVRACILVTKWNEFKALRPKNFTEHMKEPVVVDGQGTYNPKEFGREVKFAAIGLGEKRNYKHKQ